MKKTSPSPLPEGLTLAEKRTALGFMALSGLFHHADGLITHKDEAFSTSECLKAIAMFASLWEKNSPEEHDAFALDIGGCPVEYLLLKLVHSRLVNRVHPEVK